MNRLWLRATFLLCQAIMGYLMVWMISIRMLLNMRICSLVMKLLKKLNTKKKIIPLIFMRLYRKQDLWY